MIPRSMPDSSRVAERSLLNSSVLLGAPYHVIFRLARDPSEIRLQARNLAPRDVFAATLLL